MQLLIKITTEPMQVTRFSQGGRLVSSDSVDMERRKAIARHISMSRTNNPFEDITKINRTFSQNANAIPQVQQEINPQIASQQSPKTFTPTVRHSKVMATADTAEGFTVSTSSAPIQADPTIDQGISVEASSSYVTQRGAFEMRVAKGDLTYLPPLVMTIITQRPQVHVEYIGGFNYVPPSKFDAGSNINLFT